MVYSSRRLLNVLNISLSLLCFVLVISLFGVTFPNLGMAFEAPSGPMECSVTWKDTANSWDDIDRCCLEAKKQLGCEKEQNRWVCSTGESSIKIHLSSSAFDYCLKQDFWR